MFRQSSQFILVGMATAAVMTAAGCSKKAEDEGAAKISVMQALSLAGDVKAVEVNVTGTGIAAPMNMPLFLQADGSWKGLVNHIPTGSDRIFSAKAYDSAAKTHEIYSGSVSMVTITKDSIADVTIVLQENQAPGGFANHAPVVDGLTVSSTKAIFGEKIAYTVTAHDQDQGESATLTFTPSASCGTFAAPSLTTDASGKRVWAALWTAPASGASCQLNMEIADVHGAKAMAAATIALWNGPDVGGARVATLVQSFPTIQNITATPVAPATTLTVGGGVQLNVLATQPDGEAMTFAWTTDCNGAFDNAAAQSPTFTLGAAASACTFDVVASNPVKTGSDGVAVPASTVGHLTVNVGATAPAPAVGGVTVDLTSQSLEAINGGQTVTLYVRARETNSAASLTTYAWSAVNGSLSAQTDAADKSFSQIVWTAPAAMAASESITVTATDSQGATAAYTFVIRSASNPCAGAGTDGAACSDGNPCTVGDACLAGACVAGAPKVCAATDSCHTAGTCDTVSGTCSNPVAADGTTCDDGNACSTASSCAAGSCLATANVVCAALDTCHDAGTCQASTGTCSNPAKVDGTTCSDGNACTTGDSCQAGSCTGGAPVVCTGATACSTAACVPATGCVVTPAADGTPCTDNNGCTTGDSCHAGACVAGAPTVCTASDLCHTAGTCDPVAGMCSAETVSVTCDYGQLCEGSTGHCVRTTPTVGYAKNYAVSSVGGMTVDGSGSQYIVAKLFGTVNFGSGNVTSAGSSDIALVKLDPTTGLAVWSKVFGGSGESSNPSDQIPSGVAVNTAGKIAVLGTFTSNLIVNGTTTVNGAASALDFVMGTDASGAGQWGVKVDTQAGSLTSVAGNPARNEFVVCGYALGGVTDLGLSGSSGGDGLEDIIIAKLSETGSVLWARQIGGAGTQLCKTVALGADGTVYAAGVYNGSLDLGTGALPSYSSSVQAVWVAKLDSTDGHALASKSFGTAGKQAANSIAVDASGNVAIAGNVRGSIPFGTYTVTAAGGIDAYVAKLDSSLTPQWATRWGDTADQAAKSVSFSSVGDLVVVGYIKGSAVLGATTLTSAGLSDAYWAKFSGVDGSAVASALYGNASYDQSADVVAISRAATNAQKDKISVAGFGNGTFSVGSTSLTSTTANGFVFQMNP